MEEAEAKATAEAKAAAVEPIHADSWQRKTRCCAFLVALVVSLVALILVSPEPTPLSRYYCSGL